MKKLINLFFYGIQAVLFFAVLIGIFYGAYKVNRNYFIFFVFLTYGLNAIVTLIIFNQTRSELSKLSWLLIIIVFPLVGHAAYFAFGSKYKNKREKKLVKDPTYQLKTYQHLFQTKSLSNDQFEHLINLNGGVALDANYKFYQHPGDYFTELYENLKEAKKHIFIISYIIKPGEILDELVEILKEKANQGVKIYWLIDDFGRTLVNKQKHLKKLLNHGNIEIVFISKVFYPFIHSQNFYRNHQKFYVIDSEIVFAGGCNISDEYVGLSKKYAHWIDLNYRLIGPQINAYILLFLRSWKLWANKKTSLVNDPQHFFNFNTVNLDKDALSSSLLVHESPVYDTSHLEYNLLGMFALAKKSVRIVTPYFSIPSSLFNMLKMLLFAGIEVEVYFPGYPDKKVFWKASLNMLQKLEKYGLKLYLYKDGFLHTKCGLIDDKIAFVGSSNTDMRSMYAQYEIMDIVKGQAVEEIKNIIDTYQSKSILNSDNPINNKTNLFTDTLYEVMRPVA
ncbi:cardiolipin synthetase [Mycoplasmopsis columbina SF7]|uniref:Cardiolipin synthetase n=1 Tax=Mycoplasmopsis columbina SF7 TaxID=1037410 RepID=F9UJ99_9BACT|nr:phospholipase D-like domain-containing protein [Mycoplasmopsis columbina]EGV00542.1 cardiolipin synthetase [Mycoplasmopsis columbina SF7]